MARSGHKKIDVWKFNVEGIIHPVDIHMVRPTDDRSMYKIQFTASSKALEISIRNADLDALRKEAQELVNARAKVTWHNKLWVQLTAVLDSLNPDEHEEMKTEISITVAAVQICECNGQKRQRRHNLNSGRGSDGWPETGKQTDHWNRSYMNQMALIDDTPANRAALDELQMGFRVLADRLSKLLDVDMIQKTLNNIKTQPLLPMPKK